MENIFTYIGILSTIIIIGALLYIGISIFMVQFKHWRKHGCKFKFLCKHTYEIQFVNGRGEMGMECINCGKRKVLHFEEKSIKAFIKDN